jgi:hypothetical protein
MTTETAPAGGPASTPTAAAPASEPSSSRPRGRRWLWPLVVTAAVVAVGLASAALTRTDRRADLDPRSATPGGSRAVARILSAQGVRVDVVTRSDAAVDGATADTTVVVANPALLGPRQWNRLRDSPADLVLLEPDDPVLVALAPGVTPAGRADATPADPACPDPDAAAAGSTTAGGRLYTVTATSAATACYPDARYPDRRAMVRVDSGVRRVTVLGQRRVLQNDSLVVDGNAALALRVLGAHPQLRWYLPDPVELGQGGDAPSLGALTPSWVRFAAVQLGVVALVAFVWRGRRLGRVVTEPLPVVVRSAETVEGRARLYRTGRARDHAAAILRTAAARRSAARLGVPPHARPAEVAQLAAAATGQDPAVVHRTLLGDPPRDDADLVALAAALDALEQAVAGEPEPGHEPGHEPEPGPGEPDPAGRYAGRRTGEGGR